MLVHVCLWLRGDRRGGTHPATQMSRLGAAKRPEDGHGDVLRESEDAWHGGGKQPADRSPLHPTPDRDALLRPTEVATPTLRSTAPAPAPAAPSNDGVTLPLPQSIALAATYMCTSMCFFLVIRHTKSHKLAYNNAFIVFGIEITKLSVSVALKYREDGEFLPKTVLFSPQRRAIWRGGLPYAVPSFLYAVYNNMTFLNLNLFHAGTYQVFMQTRILFTGILFSVLLRQALTLRKWVALLLLMVGVASKYFSPDTLELNAYVLLMLFQAFLSSLAGVYNEYALKKERHLSIHQQNFFMYLYALFFNAVFGVLADPGVVTRAIDAAVTLVAGRGEVKSPQQEPLQQESIGLGLVVLLIAFGAATGLSAAFILKFINIIVKAFASAVEVLLTAVVAAAVLGEALTGSDVVAASIVMVSVYTYYTRGWGDQRSIAFGTESK